MEAISLIWKIDSSLNVIKSDIVKLSATLNLLSCPGESSSYSLAFYKDKRNKFSLKNFEGMIRLAREG